MTRTNTTSSNPVETAPDAQVAGRRQRSHATPLHSARGLPRLINRIAHHALTIAAVNDARTVNAAHLEHAVAELRL